MISDARRNGPRLAFSKTINTASTRLTFLALDAYSTPVKTPASNIPHNFGPVSPRDDTLYTAERPGNPLNEDATVSSQKVHEWIDFIKNQGVGHVIVLLDGKEFEIYEEPGLLELYKAGGLGYLAAPMSENGAYERVVAYLEEVRQKGEKAVTHCTGGIGRAGRVAAAWLVYRYNLDVEAATKETIEVAVERGICRLGHAENLAQWIENN